MPGTDIATRLKTQMQKATWPEHLTTKIDFPGWVMAIAMGSDYKEPIPGYISKMLALEAILASTPEEVYKATGVKGLQEIIPDVPDATTGPHEILDLYVAESDIETGYSCFIIVEWLDLEMGGVSKWTTSATNVMSTLIGLLKFNQWPIRCQIKRGDSKDKSGKHLLLMLPPD
jgi:hypothetical protein